MISTFPMEDVVKAKYSHLLHSCSPWRMTIRAATNCRFLRRKKEMKVIKVLRNGCLQRWGWWEKWWTRIALQRKSSRRLKIISSGTILTRSTLPTILVISQLESAVIVTQPKPLFGGAVLEVPRLYTYLLFLSVLIGLYSTKDLH